MGPPGKSRADDAMPNESGTGPSTATGDAHGSVFVGGGEMGTLMRSLDWSRTPLGPVETWPQSLRMMVRFLLANRFPLLLWWGPEYASIYNDAYRPILGRKHPASLGQPVREVWHEIWHVLQPLIDTPFNGGPSTWMEDIPLEINRHGFVEETHFTIAYSPVPDEAAPRGIGGVLATVHEITEKVVGERRTSTLRDLGARSAEGKTAEEACAIAAQILSTHAHDVPFALLYLTEGDGTRARLAGAAGVALGEPISPYVVALTDADQRPHARVLGAGIADLGLGQPFGKRLLDRVEILRGGHGAADGGAFLAGLDRHLGRDFFDEQVELGRAGNSIRSEHRVVQRVRFHVEANAVLENRSRALEHFPRRRRTGERHRTLPVEMIEQIPAAAAQQLDASVRKQPGLDHRAEHCFGEIRRHRRRLDDRGHSGE